MKRTLFKLSIIPILLMLFAGFTSQAQEVGESQKVFSEGQPVYWFYIKVRIDTDPKTKIKKYGVRLMGKKVYAGTVDEYSVNLWRHLSRGSKLAIGPFENYTEAEQSLTFYDNLSEDTVIIDDAIEDKNRQIYYYPLEVYIRPRSHSYGIRRIPAAVMPGRYESFAFFLQNSLINKKLAIGPFYRPQVAEESKRLYRLQ